MNQSNQTLFTVSDFIAHSGLSLSWKIDCDALTDNDIDTLAYLVGRKLSFGSVEGIPRGGLRFAKALYPYITAGAHLIVDDVLTTGGSMEAARKSSSDIGVVIFSRGILVPNWIHPIFRYDWEMLLVE